MTGGLDSPGARSVTSGGERHRVSWTLSIDFGTTATVAAVTDQAGRGELVDFGRTTRLPSGVFVHPDGRLLTGRVAASQGGADPARYVRTPKRHVGADPAIRVAGADVDVAELVAAVLDEAATFAGKRAGGGKPARTVLTHPARWGATARARLAAAATLAGLGDAELVPEPLAAGWAAATATRDGATVAVYDLGGGTFDAAVLRRDGDAWRLAGKPGGLAACGGEQLDALLNEHLLALVQATSPEVADALQRPSTRGERGHARTWWRDLRAVKEGLSEVASLPIMVPASGDELLVSRDELEELARPVLDQTIAELRRVLADAGAGPAPDEIVMSGDASLMPLVRTALADAFEVPVTLAFDPKAVVAIGAVAVPRATAPEPKAKPKKKKAKPKPEAAPEAAPVPPSEMGLVLFEPAAGIDLGALEAAARSDTALQRIGAVLRVVGTECWLKQEGDRSTAAVAKIADGDPGMVVEPGPLRTTLETLFDTRLVVGDPAVATVLGVPGFVFEGNGLGLHARFAAQGRMSIAGRAYQVWASSPDAARNAAAVDLSIAGPGDLGSGSVLNVGTPLVAPGGRRRESILAEVRDLRSNGGARVVLRVTRDSALDQGRAGLEEAALAGLDVPVAGRRTVQVPTPVGPATAISGTSKRNGMTLAVLSAAAHTPFGHVGMVVMREQVRTSLLRAPDPLLLCQPFLSAARIVPPGS